MKAPYLIGEHRDQRPTCEAAGVCYPNCYNPNSDDTYCQCGTTRWPGQVGTWHSPALYDGADRGAKIIGWDVYFLHADGCGDSARVPDVGHVCRPATMIESVA